MIAEISIVVRAFCIFLMSTAVLPRMFRHAMSVNGAGKIKRVMFILGLVYTLSMFPFIWFQFDRMSASPTPWGLDLITVINAIVNIVVVLAFYCIYL